MKFIIVLLFLASTCSKIPLQRDHKFKVLIWDINPSMSYSARYFINSDSLIISFISGLEGEANNDVLSRKINKNESDRFIDFLRLFPIDTISSKYIDPSIDDGDVKRIEIEIDSKKKSVEVNNMYQRDISRLIDIVNECIEEKYRIKYVSAE